MFHVPVKKYKKKIMNQSKYKLEIYNNIILEYLGDSKELILINLLP